MFHLRIIMMAIRGLRQNLLRSILATLGVIIGVGAVISAVSILQGAQRDILERFETLGADQIIVFNGTDEHGHRRTMTQSLEPEDAVLIQQENEDVVIATSPQYNGGGQVKYYQRNAPVTILGTTESYPDIFNYHPAQGRFITRDDVRGNAMVAVLGSGVADDLLGALPAEGKSVKINGKSFIVIGVMEEKGALGFSDVDNQVIIPLTTAMQRMFGSEHLSNLVVQCISAERAPVCTERIKKTLRMAHRIRAGEDDDFIIFTQDQFKKQLGQVTKVLAVVLYSIAGISLVVGAIGIMNIMLVSVTERTREIGVRIAVGARRFDILKQFLIEASIISMLGGGLGVICGWAIANFLSKFTQVLETYTPPAAVVAGLLMAFVVGVLSGIYPAVRASQLDPVQALRYE
ncbi:MAG: ABC transporter permease [Candidatus Eisenbacteria bacterium]|nr:ABC transporter permease [Candidatus Eisenbacteria bacterium]